MAKIANLLLCGPSVIALHAVGNLAVAVVAAGTTTKRKNAMNHVNHRGTLARALSLLIALALAMLSTRAAGQVRDRAGVPAASVIRGRVMTAGSGSPLARARVRLTSTADRQSITVATGQQGEFEFRDVKPGRYLLIASKGGFVQTQYGQPRAFVPGTTIAVTGSEVLENMDIHLKPGATVDGRVFDDSGEPVVDAVVMTLRNQFLGGRKRLIPTGRALTTNEKGEFHLFGLPPGAYYLTATMMSGQSVGDAAGREGYAPTYYPGRVDVALAETISLTEGEQRAAADVVLSLVRTASISGTVRDSDGRAFGSGSIAVVSTVSGFALPLVAGAILADGTFRLANVPPGSFSLVATSAATTSGSKESVVRELTVAGEDVTNLDVVAPKPATVSGRIDSELRDADPLPPGVQIRLVAATPLDDVTDTGIVLRMNPDGTFGGQVKPGSALIELAGAAPGWYLSRVLRGDDDITDTGLQTDASEDVSNIHVMLTRRATSLTGTVVDAAGRPVQEYTVAVFPRDSGRWTFRSRYVAAARPDHLGRFSVKGLPAGEYLIAAIDHVEQGEVQDPEFLVSVRSQTRTVTLGDSEGVITLTLIRRP